MLEREEYVEQAHFFRILLERLKEAPLQELLAVAKEELLATTKLPLAIDFMLAELRHLGMVSTAMARLQHYFAPFQTYVMGEAEQERGRFPVEMAIKVLFKEAEFRATNPEPQGLFLYQFETLSRNRLRYDPGLEAMARDPAFDEDWREWILTVRRQIGLVDLADLVYVRSGHYQKVAARRGQEIDTSFPVLFGEKEGRIALANRRKDPLYLFAALQRQLGYPSVPRPAKPNPNVELVPQLMRRMERLETRIKLLEEEQRSGGFDLTQFYEKSQRKREDD